MTITADAGPDEADRPGPIRRASGAIRRHPRWSSLIVAVVLVGAGVGSYFAVSGGGSSAAAATTTTTTETISTGTIRQAVSASGTLAPAQADTLSFSSSGVVTAVAVTQGQTVTKGQALATINSASLAATVAQANATVANDQAKVDSDETDSATAAQLAADQAALTAAQNQLASAQTALTGATLTSPIDGVVASVGLTVGQSVSGSGSSGGGTGATGGSGSTTSTTSTGSIEVISTNAWIVNATVDATSVDLIKAGNQAQLTITGATGTVYGTISSIAVISSSTSGTASYPVVVAVTGAPTGLHDGASVTASLIYKQLTDVVVVPVAALHRDTSGEYVDKVVDGKAVKTPVTVGISSGTQTQITAGLVAGDKVQIQRTVPTGTGTGTTRTGTTNGRTGTGGGTGNFPGGTGGGTGNFPGGAGGGAGGGAAPGGGTGG